MAPNGNPSERSSGPPQGSRKQGGRGQGRPRRDRRPQPQGGQPSGGNHPRQESRGNGNRGPRQRWDRPAQPRPPRAQPQTLTDGGRQSILNIRNLVVIAILIGLILFVVKIISVLGIFIFSFVLAFLLYPMVDYFAKKGISRLWSIIIVYLILGTFIAALMSAVIPVLVTQAYSFVGQLPDIVRDLQAQFSPKFAAFQKFMTDQGVKPEDIQNYINQVIPSMQDWAVNFGKRIASGIQGAVGGIVASLSIPVIVFYLLLDAAKIRDSLIGFIPKRTGAEVEFLLDRLSNMLNHYLRGQLKLCSIIFLITLAGLSILGVPHALFLAMIGGLTEVVPIIGPLIAWTPSLIISLTLPWTYGLGGWLGSYGVEAIQLGWFRGIIVTLFYLGMQWGENNLIVPRVMGHNLNLHPLTVMFSLLAGGYLAGVFGMLMALPTAACLKVIFEIYYAPFINSVEELMSRAPAAGSPTESSETDFGE